MTDTEVPAAAPTHGLELSTKLTNFLAEAFRKHLVKREVTDYVRDELVEAFYEGLWSVCNTAIIGFKSGEHLFLTGQTGILESKVLRSLCLWGVHVLENDKHLFEVELGRLLTEFATRAGESGLRIEKEFCIKLIDNRVAIIATGEEETKLPIPHRKEWKQEQVAAVKPKKK